ncbi:phage protease [Tissierella carlieri]|uniref:phage protease n=1 Tax=Tissierella carlieri TaxID=689904 RepID=UPI001C1253FF|nr:phage protease [Tissierella carlieri]MBU5312228.1 phage protease [Tissierella carlieri]
MAKKFVLNISSSEIQGVPEIIKLLPLGTVKSQKGNFIVDEESFESINNTFKKRGIDVVIDYEHQTLEDVQAPAGGWIKELFIQDGAIAAKVEWTPKAQEYLKNKEYRYLSPVVLVRKSDQKAVVLHSAALTNTPAIDGMFAIVNSINIDEFEEGGKNMDLKKLAAILGLPEDATEEQIIQAIKTTVGEVEKLKDEAKKQETKTEGDEGNTETVANKVICGLLGIDNKDAKTEDVAAAIMALKNPANFVPVTEFNRLKERLDKKDGEELVTKALKAGKISAAQKEWAEEYALKDPEGFKKFVEKAPQAVPMGEIELDDIKKDDGKLSDTTMSVCKMLGVSKEDLEKYGKEVK